MNVNRKKPGPKLPYDDLMLQKAIEAVETAPGSLEVNQKNVAGMLNRLFSLGYNPRAGDMDSHIQRVLQLRQQEDEQRKIASLPNEVLAALDASLQDLRYGQMLILANAAETLARQIQLPLLQAQQEVRRANAAFDAECARRVVDTERADKAEKQIEALQKRLSVENRKFERLEKKQLSIQRKLEKEISPAAERRIADMVIEQISK